MKKLKRKFASLQLNKNLRGKRYNLPLPILTILFITTFLVNQINAVEVRIKDISKIQGVTKNQLIGYGLVVGLARTGDSQGVISTVQSVANMLKHFGVTVTAAQIRVRNVAAVMVTAELPPFATAGERVDAVVSSIGDATSLEGGTLLLTPLQAPNGEIYATVQGPISIGGFNVGAAGGARQQKNHPVAGRVPEGALIVRDFVPDLVSGGKIYLVLDQPDFNTALRIARAINTKFSQNLAQAKDASRIEVKLSEEHLQNLVHFIATVENLKVSPDISAQVVINERTGTVVIGKEVRITPVAISHGNLTVTITAEEKVVQPPPLSPGVTVVTPRAQIKVKEEKQNLMLIKEGNTIEAIVKALNSLGVTPRDLIAVLQAIKEAGALAADLKII